MYSTQNFRPPSEIAVGNTKKINVKIQKKGSIKNAYGAGQVVDNKKQGTWAQSLSGQYNSNMARTLDKKSIKILNNNISKKLMNSSDPNEKEILKKKLGGVQYSPARNNPDGNLNTDGTADNN